MPKLDYTSRKYKKLTNCSENRTRQKVPKVTLDCMSCLFCLLLLLPFRHQKAPQVFRVKFETTAGSFLVEVHRDWSPHGADRFYHLVRMKYYDDSRFFRVVPGRWVQFGISGNPTIAQQQRRITIPESELSWRFSRSSGPGGQHVNTTDTRVEVLWDLASTTALTEAQRERVASRLRGRRAESMRRRDCGPRRGG